MVCCCAMVNVKCFVELDPGRRKNETLISIAKNATIISVTCTIFNFWTL